MRTNFLLLALLAILALVPFTAKAESVAFGTSVCGTPFPCENLRKAPGPIVTSANQCASQSFMMTNAADNFDPSGFFDSSQCITTLSKTVAKQGLTMQLKCCAKPVPNNAKMCNLVCTQFGIR